jgi:hypothetical protein
MLTKNERQAQYKLVEAVQKRRATNLQYCMRQAGSWAQLAKWTGDSPQLLMMIAGDNRSRSFSELMARRLEQRLGLGSGWMDEKH